MPRLTEPTSGPTGGLWAAISPSYIRRPDWERSSGVNPVLAVASLFVLGFVGAIAMSMLQAPAIDYGEFDSQLVDTLDSLSWAEQFSLVVIMAPVLEEIAYRLPLMSRLVMPLLVFSGVLLGLVYWWPLLGLAVVALIVLAIQPARDSIIARWEADARWPVWISVALFGLLHLVNFDFDLNLTTLLLAPAVVGPQLWLGVVFTISRIRFGWTVGLVQHAAHNLMVWLVSYLVLN